jgi:hypothetical protein
VRAPRHTNEPICPSCEKRLEGAHPNIAKWFRETKKRHRILHIAWAYRDAVTQNRMFWEKKTRKQYPNSEHNRTEDGKPCSRALDLFVITEEGEEKWPPMLYAKINAENVANREPVEWSGEWVTFKETCHFQLKAYA